MSISSRFIVLICCLAMPLTAVPARSEPWVAKRTDLGPTAIGLTKIAPSTLATEWNVLAIGLFCGLGILNPRGINLYVYGVGADRLAQSTPLEGVITIDDRPTLLSLQPFNDIAFAPVSADLVRNLMRARTVTIELKNYHTPRVEEVDLNGAAAALRKALQRCLKP